MSLASRPHRWILPLVRAARAELRFFYLRDPAAALQEELARRALQEAADFVQKNMTQALFCRDRFEHLSVAYRQAPASGLALEFGVYKGATLRHLAEEDPARSFVGFDSFRGLPEDWAGSRHSDRNFDVGGSMPSMPANVTLVDGWFDETLPRFLRERSEPASFVHIDCDIYSSTKLVLEALSERLAEGCVLVFDEFFNYKAFLEWIDQLGRPFTYIAYSGRQVSVRIG
ncbi:MAG: class I SAM-dependent methyltransferase [Alphaproteobacteria bacterium]|nr:class I SAM-dependent methyltransferase [Alphaproteobacteria bacterium]